METRPDAVDPPSAADLAISQMLRRWAPNLDAHRDPRSVTFVWSGESRSARPARKTSLFGKPTFGGPTETKKPGPSLLQVASPVWRGSPVRLRLPVCSRWLTGLLSGSPPTDTRPQARAKLGKEISNEIAPPAQAFFRFFSASANGRKREVNLLPCKRNFRDREGSCRAWRWQSARAAARPLELLGRACRPGMTEGRFPPPCRIAKTRLLVGPSRAAGRRHRSHQRRPRA
jgi:hypothetical protein